MGKKVRMWVGIWLLMVMVALGSGVRAEDKPSADFSTDILSQYVWRGFALSDDSIVIQPSMTVSYLGAYVNFWGNYDTDQDTNGEAKWNETDFTFGYTYNELPYGLALDVGGIYYALDGTQDSFEFFVGLSGTCPVTGASLGLTVYREISHYPSWWVELSAGKSFDLPWRQSSLSLGISTMYLNSEDSGAYADPDDPDDEFSGWLYVQLGAEVSIPFGEYFTVTPKLYYSFAVSDDAKDMLADSSWDGNHDHLYGGINIQFAF